MTELHFLIAIGGATAGLVGRHLWRIRRRSRRAQALSMSPTVLGPFARALDASVLMRILDGAHDRGMVGDVVYEGDRERRRVVFRVEAQRDLRGEWGYLEVEPPFRLESPLTCLAMDCTTSLSSFLIKRRGRSERLRDAPYEALRSVAHLTRDISTVDRHIAVEPPPGLPPLGIPLEVEGADFLVWSGQPGAVQAALDGPARAALTSPTALSRELVIELAPGALLAYVALDGLLDDRTAAALLEVLTTLARALERGAPRLAEPASGSAPPRTAP